MGFEGNKGEFWGQAGKPGLENLLSTLFRVFSRVSRIIFFNRSGDCEKMPGKKVNTLDFKCKLS